MTVYTVKIDEKTREGKLLIAKLKTSSGVVSIQPKKTSSKSKIKSKSITQRVRNKEDEALAALMRKEETGKLVSKATIMKSLRSIK